MDKKQVIKLINDQIENQNLAVGSLSVSSHTHNGADSPQIPFKYIKVYPGNGNTVDVDTGIALVNGDFMYNIYILDTGGNNPLVIQPNQEDSSLYFGLSAPFTGIAFNKIFMNVDGQLLSPEITFNAQDALGSGTNTGFTSLTPGQYDIQTSDGTLFSQVDFFPQGIVIQNGTISDPFAITLPESAQPTPVKGMYSFDGVSFKAVDGSGTFKFIPTSDATTTGNTTAAGTVRVTINGTDFDLLFA